MGAFWEPLRDLLMLTSDPCSVLGEVFVVQWDKVRLQGREAEGTFTFQAALHNNGTIAFNYREVSFLIQCTIIGLFFFTVKWMLYFIYFDESNDLLRHYNSWGSVSIAVN